MQASFGGWEWSTSRRATGGLARFVYYFSRGQVKTREIFGYQRETPSQYFRDIDGAIAAGTTHFLFYAAPYRVFPRETHFVEHVVRRGLGLRRHVISDAHGEVYIMYEVVCDPGPGG